MTEHGGPALGTVLVVDDELRSRESLRDLLTATGYRVVLAADGPQAIELVAKEPPDLILLDSMMPEMDGHQVASAIKDAPGGASIPIVMITASSSRKARTLGARAGVQHFLARPVDPVELNQHLRSLIRPELPDELPGGISEKLASEVALRANELAARTEVLEKQARALTQLAALLDLAHDAIMVLDLKGHILFWSAGAKAMYGWSKEEALGAVCFELLEEQLSEPRKRLHASLLRNNHWEGEVIRRTRDGRRIAIANRLTLQRDSERKPVLVLSINIDVTERKRADRALQSMREDELRFKDDFLSHVSHELRSPLTAIKQFTTILIGGLAGELNDEQLHYEGIVLKNVHQLQSMIDDLLEVTRLETGKLTIELGRVAVPAVVTDAVQTLAVTAGSKGVVMSYDLPSDLPAVYVDPTRLLQMLIILLDNAVKFTQGGGAVRIKARRLQEDTQFLHLDVTDTGCGIAPELLPKLFERHFQVAEHVKTSRKGVGLGLYICKELVMRQGGSISVKSKVRKGTTFTLTLPLFSLSRLIAPLAQDGRWPADQVALLTINLRIPGEATSSESGGGPSHEARNFIQKCLLPDLDLLLPITRSTTQGEFFFVLVFADEKGRSVLTHRLREQFQHSRALNRAGRTLSLSYTLLPPFERDIGSGVEEAAATMAEFLEQAVQSLTHPEVLQHEQPQTIDR